MKVYVLIDDWARDDAAEINVIGVYKDKKRAQLEILIKKDELFTTEMDTKEIDDMSVCQYESGNYHSMHDRLFIQEVEFND